MGDSPLSVGTQYIQQNGTELKKSTEKAGRGGEKRKRERVFCAQKQMPQAGDRVEREAGCSKSPPCFIENINGGRRKNQG